MSLNKHDMIELGMLREHQTALEFTYERHVADDSYEGLRKGTRRIEASVVNRRLYITTSLMYRPNKGGGFGGSFKSLFQKRPYAVLHTPKFSILFNL